ncbi:MAG: hypothetical protein R3D55_26095 [Chloroflexota bacterium]
MKQLRLILIFSFIWLTLAACTTPTDATQTATAVPNTPPPLPTPTLAPVTTETEAPATATVEPAATAVSTQPTSAPDTNNLLTLVQADIPANAFDGLDVLALNLPAGQEPLWAVYSVGFHNFDLDPWPSHFVALYTWRNDSWQEVARQLLNVNEQGEMAFGPDYLYEQGVTQVELADDDPQNIWLAIDGGVGAHGGTFQLLRFDGTAFHLEINTSNSSPGVGYLEDLNGDGSQEVIIYLHDYYVFCYACGVRYLQFGVYTWDAVNQRLLEVSLQPMLMGQQGHPARQPTNRAVELANADLWPQALIQIEEAERLAAESDEPTDTYTLNWDAALIRLYNQAYQAELQHAPYPLLTHIFYGDFAAALDIMRGYGNEQIFSATSPLIQGTMAEGNEPWLADYLLRQSSAALAVPNLDPATLAAAYYFHAWGSYLQNPADAEITADLQQAATLVPTEPLYIQVTLPTVQRIQFAPGAISATVQGDVAAHVSDDYILSAAAGQTMTVVIESPNSNVLLTIVGADGIPLTNGLMSGATSWTGELPATQDYIVRAIGTLEPAAYTLTVTIE